MEKNWKFLLYFVANIETTASTNGMANERTGVDEVSSFKETELGSLMFRVDPVSRVLHRFRTVQRRVYNVTRPNHLW